MSKSSRKGAGGEREWAAFVGGEKLSRLGYEGPDVMSPSYRVTGLAVWEVKRIKLLPKWFVAWLTQSLRADALVFRQDNDRWWVVIPASRLVPDA